MGHGPLRQWVKRMTSFSECWQGWQSAAWTSTMRRSLPTLHGPLRQWVKRMTSFSKRWQGWQSGTWTNTMGRSFPTLHGPLRQWVNRMTSFSKRWQGWQSGAWTSSMGRSSPTLHGLLQLSTTTQTYCLGQKEERLLKELAAAAEWCIRDFNSQALSNTAWAFNTVGYEEERHFTALA